MHRLPLLFQFKFPIMGREFAAVVQASGRVVLEEEDGERVWMYGAEPGGIAAAGDNRDEAFAEFRQAFVRVLDGMAAEAESIEEFEANAARFLLERCESTYGDWDSALAEVRRGEVGDDVLKRTKAEDITTSMTVQKLEFSDAPVIAMDLSVSCAA